MTRLPDWERRLGEYLLTVLEKPFAYGEHDCALHGANAVHAATGIDHGAPFRGKYTTELGAAKALKKYGGGTIEATFDQHLDECPLAFASRGDIVMFENAIGVCAGGDALFVGQNDVLPGLVRVPRARWSKAWKV